MRAFKKAPSRLGERGEICRTPYNKRDMGKREQRARPGPRRGGAVRAEIEWRLARWDDALASRLVDILCLGDGCCPHLREALAVVEEVCRIHSAGKLVSPSVDLTARARRGGVNARRLWAALNNPDATRAEVERKKAAELIEAARMDRRTEIEAALRFMAEDDKETRIRADGSEEDRLRGELLAMEPGARGAEVEAKLAKLRQDEEEKEARLMALRVEIGAAADVDSLCEPWPAEELHYVLKRWRRADWWRRSGRGPSAEALRRILGMSRQAIARAARRGRHHKTARTWRAALTPGRLANVLRDYAKGGGPLADKARRTAEVLAALSAKRRE